MQNNGNNGKNFDNLEYLNKKRLLDNSVYAKLLFLKNKKEELNDVSRGIDYEQMYYALFKNHTNNLENYIIKIVAESRELNQIIENIEEKLKKILLDNYNISIILSILDTIYDIYNINTVLKKYKITKKELLTRLTVVAELMEI